MHVDVEGLSPTRFHFGPPAPAAPLAMTVFRHSSIGVEWFASGQAALTPDGASFTVSLDPSCLDSGSCLELRAQDEAGQAIELDKAFFTHGSDGWKFTPDRPEELKVARAAFFAQPVVVPGATANARSFRGVALIEGLLLTQNTRVPGIEIYGLARALGSEQATVEYLSALSGELFGLPFAGAANPNRGLPCAALKFSDVRADTADAALPVLLEMAGRMTDLLGFNRLARPQVVSVAVLDDADGGTFRYWLDPTRTRYVGNLIGGFIAGESTQDLLTQWSHMNADPRLALWLTQINDARAERRWEYRVLRYFNLLEGIAKGSIGTKEKVLDGQGQPRLQGDGKPYTTKEARGAVYAVIAGLCRYRGDVSEDGFCAYASLWELCQHWTTVRNQVAHAGAWESSFKVAGIANVEAFLTKAPEQRRTDLESVLVDCVRVVVDGVIFRGYLPL